ncbi:MAG: winged-helix domain-containing protein [Clostridia bacterium]|nr:winged-helix domain-containing protein [Clostridia bacterium]
MDICIVTNDSLLARFLILELFEAGFSSEQAHSFSSETRLNIVDLDFCKEEPPSGSIGFSYSDAQSKRVSCFIPRPIGVQTLLSAVKERLLPDKKAKALGISVSVSTRKATADSKDVRLSEKELALLLMLKKTPLLSREDAAKLFEDADSNVVDVYMHYLRRKLKKICPYDVIKSKRGEGYSLIYPIELV